MTHERQPTPEQLRAWITHLFPALIAACEIAVHEIDHPIREAGNEPIRRAYTTLRDLLHRDHEGPYAYRNTQALFDQCCRYNPFLLQELQEDDKCIDRIYTRAVDGVLSDEDKGKVRRTIEHLGKRLGETRDRWADLNGMPAGGF